jgi:magnesium transporter
MEHQLRQSQARAALEAKTYPPSSVGALMETDIIALKPEMTSKEAVDYLRSRMKVRRDQTLQAVYVTNDQGHPIGALSLRSLIAAPVDTRISELMTPASLIRLQAIMDREEAAKIFSHYKLMTAPVVDEENKLIGQVSASEIVRVIQQEDTEDIQKQAGVEVLDEPYFKTSFLKLVQKRGSWLSVLFLGEMLTATAMTYFEKEIARAVVLALFVPLIISSGGNSGSQAATLIVRAMALREINFGDWWRVMRREFAVGLALGLLLGTLGFLRIFLWSQVTPIYGEHYLLIALTVGFALVLVVLWGSLTGSLLPMFLKKIGLDPAVASAPFVATLVDVTGLIIYFMTGLFILKGTLL